LAAVRTDGHTFGYAAKESLKCDRDSVLAVVAQRGSALEYADESMKRDRDVVLATVRKVGMALQFADKSLTRDLDVVRAAVRNNGSARRFADFSLLLLENSEVFEAEPPTTTANEGNLALTPRQDSKRV